MKRLTSYNAHAAVSRFNGRDVLVTNYFDNTNEILMIDVETGESKTIMSFGKLHYACHISACDKPFVLVSCYDTENVLPAQLWRVWFDGRPHELIYEFKLVYRDYSSQPHASLSQDGTMAVFTVDDGAELNVWAVRLDTVPSVIDTPTVTRTRIDYAPYVGKSTFELVPRADGAVDIYEVKK